MKLLDGKAAAAAIKQEVAAEVKALPGRKPAIALVRVGEDPASRVYVGSKAKASEECGIVSRGMHLDESVSEEKLLGVLRDFNEDDDVDGILLQLPLPRHIDADRAIATISPEKDVDGFHPESIGRLAAGNPRFVPCTPLGIRELLLRNGVKTAGANVVVLGRSVIVGKPMALLFALKGPGGDATVTICHSRSRDIAAHTRGADIIVAAMGVPRFLKGDMVREGAVVVDVGINRVDDPGAKKGYRIVGDVDFDAVAPHCEYITPVPGGVGPMTVAMLMSNTLSAFRNRQAGHVVR
ncbi:MAG TPA: bifunctional methylenetetrahydrofolate dehydrogenase/methenyltetrahydrofolate cyclohydrolase FolD [Candidatus Krumholzibacteria bacterium]|nr:bifunctional methylenetetrahydrofolate dehydrogenase/methenyltetrahydrofolate cyclohydrolase FolD [Candidatus Krumholzibacteria bacterium]